MSIWALMTHTDSRKTANGCHHQQQEVINIHKLESAFLHEYAGAVLVCSPTDTSIFQHPQCSCFVVISRAHKIPYRAGWSGYLAALKLSLSDKYHTFCSRKGLVFTWNSETSLVVNKSKVRSNEYIQREASHVRQIGEFET